MSLGAVSTQPGLNEISVNLLSGGIKVMHVAVGEYRALESKLRPCALDLGLQELVLSGITARLLCNWPGSSKESQETD